SEYVICFVAYAALALHDALPSCWGCTPGRATMEEVVPPDSARRALSRCSGETSAALPCMARDWASARACCASVVKRSMRMGNLLCAGETLQPGRQRQAAHGRGVQAKN